MPVTYKKIASVTVGAGGQAAITFSSIPSTYTDLKIVASVRNSSTTAGSFPTVFLKLNGSTTTFTGRYVEGNGTTASSATRTDSFLMSVNADSSTASTFSNLEIYIPNYNGSTNKSFSVDGVSENNATLSYAQLTAGLWSTTSAITSAELYFSANNFMQYSTATLYGISKS